MSGEQLAVVSVVTVGKFNPSIAQPSWFASEGLITKAEADAAQIEVIHPEVSDFTVLSPDAGGGGALRVQMLRERLYIATEDARLYEMTRDLSVGILTLLRHTPISKLGINYDCHVNLPSDDARNALGRRLAPQDPWNDALRDPALLSLSMKSARPDGLEGHIVVKVEPSARFPFGVFVAVNDHFDISAPDGYGAEKVVDVLKTAWDPSLKRSREVLAKVTK